MTTYTNLSVEKLKQRLIVAREYLLQNKNLVDIEHSLSTDKDQVVLQMEQNQEKSIFKLMLQIFSWIVLKPANMLGDMIVKIVDMFSSSQASKNKTFDSIIVRILLFPLYIFIAAIILIFPALLMESFLPQLGSFGITVAYIGLIIGLYFSAKKYNDKKTEKNDVFINQISQIDNEINEVQVKFNQIINTNEMQEISSFIPERYFNLHAVESFLVYLFEGRAETWKELLNTYNQDVQFHTLHNKIDQQNETLEHFGNQLQAVENAVWQQNELLHSNFNHIRNQLNTIDRKVDGMNASISNVSSNVDNISRKVR